MIRAWEAGWSFFQNEVLGMKWLDRWIGGIVEAAGLDTVIAAKQEQLDAWISAQ